MEVRYQKRRLSTKAYSTGTWLDVVLVDSRCCSLLYVPLGRLLVAAQSLLRVMCFILVQLGDALLPIGSLSESASIDEDLATACEGSDGHWVSKGIKR